MKRHIHHAARGMRSTLFFTVLGCLLTAGWAGAFFPSASAARTAKKAQRPMRGVRPATTAATTQTAAEFTRFESGTVLKMRDGQLDCQEATVAEAQAMAREHGLPLYELRDETAAFNAQEQPQTGLKIVLRGTAQLDQFPEAKAAFLRAARAWESLIQNRITVVIDVDFGPTFFGAPFGEFGGLTNSQDLSRPNAYPLVRDELIKSAGSPQEAALYRALPPDHVATNQGPATEMSYSTALLRALGRIAPVADPEHEPANWGPPPRIGFNSAHSYDFDQSDGIKVKRDDFTALAMHEIGHVLGFGSGVGRKELRLYLPPTLEVLDLFRFRPGVTFETFGTALRVLSSGGEQVFFGGGAELPLSTGRNDASGGDLRQAGHWKDLFLSRQYLGVMDPLSFRGYRYEMTANDREAFECMGYRTNPLPNPREAELKLDDGTMELGALYDGMMIVNRLTPTSYPATLRKLRLMVPLFDQQPNATGQPITLLIAAQENANEQPPPISQFMRIETTVPSASHELLLEFPIANGPTINSGDFWIGFQAPAPNEGAGFAADASNPARRTFYSTDDGASFDPLVFDDGQEANAIIRALVAVGDPEPTPTPTPVPTPTPTPNPVNVALTSGVPQDGYIDRWGPLSGAFSETQYTITVPRGATQLKFDVEANTDVDLYVRYGSRISLEGGYVSYDFKVESDEHHESLTITPASRPALRAGTYYLAMLNYGPGHSTLKVTATVIGGAPPQGKLMNVSAATFSGEALTSGMVIAAFGERLATGSEVVRGRLPTTLLGTSVKVTDSQGLKRDALVFSVSPTQVNYLMPYDTAQGSVTVTITSGDGSVSVGTSQIVTIAPGLFTANGDGRGAPAGAALRYKPDEVPKFLDLARYDAAQGRMVPAPIDLGGEDEIIVLILIGTGMRNHQGDAGVSLTIGGVAATTRFAGPVPSDLGEEQVYAIIPRALIGRGEVDVVLTVDGKTTNTVKLNIK